MSKFFLPIVMVLLIMFLASCAQQADVVPLPEQVPVQELEQVPEHNEGEELQKQPHITIDDIDERQISRFFRMSKDQISELLGDNYERVFTGAEGLVEGYAYQKLGLTFIFSDDGTELHWIEPVFLNADFNDEGYWVHEVPPKLFEIYGLNADMDFEQIQSKLGPGQTGESFIETPEHKTYTLSFAMDCYTLEFISFSEDGAYPRIRCFKSDTTEANGDNANGQPLEIAAGYISPYGTKELSREGDYKLMEMYVYDDDGNCSRRITFELPFEWHSDVSSVVGLLDEDDYYKLKVDMWNVISASREDIQNEYSSVEEYAALVYENVYTTENYEVFYCKYDIEGFDSDNVRAYYLYANGERFHMSAYVFVEDKPEYDDIFKRIAESVRFQF